MRVNRTAKNGLMNRLMNLVRSRATGQAPPPRHRRLVIEPLEVRSLLAIAYLSPVGDLGTTIERNSTVYNFTITREAEGDEDVLEDGANAYFEISGDVDENDYGVAGCAAGCSSGSGPFDYVYFYPGAETADLGCCRFDGHSNCLILSVRIEHRRSVSCRRRSRRSVVSTAMS